MRIHLNLPTASGSGSTSTDASSTSNLLSTAPAPLTALTPHGELILIELQGSLEIENQSSFGGQILGTVSFDSTRPDRPVLMISHHRLEGKFVNLVRPLAVLEKKVRGGSGGKNRSVLVDVKNGEKRRTQADGIGEKVGSVRKARKVEEANSIGREGARSSSPPMIMSPKRNRDAMDFSSSPPHATPIKPRPVARATALNGIDENGASTNQAAEEEEEEEELGDGEEPQTAVYYDVVNVIKRKILFSKRPEPIVRLDTTSSAPKA
ncbi:uncharacterized protein UTRI_03726 [Ustilago trichophora]|uniref:Chromosome transmission fidelity protein 8 n=1 Tax=Ustilago trichophora TaxID=86804 RepID=A0A5C3E1Y2_9BASI|nr:uncharacterized protein UTRI_03726 [Ustilago trichophora]